MRIQEDLGSDVAMVLDHVVGLPNTPEVVADAAERTVRWARRCRDAATRADQALFAIVQGGLDPELRVRCAEQLAGLDFAGYAVGGLSVGEEPDEMYRVLDVTVPALPSDRPRYLMGVGRPEDLLEAIRRGIDLFDCVMPTRNGRNAMAFTDQGKRRLRNAKYESDESPLEEGCPCAACRRPRAYLRHLFMAGEMLGPILLSIHNLTYYQRLLRGARAAIAEDRFEQYRLEKLRGWGKAPLGGVSDADPRRFWQNAGPLRSESREPSPPVFFRKNPCVWRATGYTRICNWSYEHTRQVSIRDREPRPWLLAKCSTSASGRPSSRRLPKN